MSKYPHHFRGYNLKDIDNIDGKDFSYFEHIKQS